MVDDEHYEHHIGRWNTGTKMGAPIPPEHAKEAAFKGWLVAWDPVKQKAAWRVERDSAWNGGTLATGGNLVFQGDDHAKFRAYDARDGKELWSFDAGRGVMAGPITYRVNGVQYVAVLAGYGGSMGMARPAPWMQTPPPPGALLVFKIGGTAKLAPVPATPPKPFATSTDVFTQAQLAEGQKWFGTYCTICHNGPVNPNLPRSAYATDAKAWNSVVIGGALSDYGMISFKPWITPEQAESVRGYVLKLAKDGAAKEAAGTSAK
jgi:mono/diheme cytochrome c family protein